MLSVQNVEITKDLDVSQNTKLKTLSLALTGIKGTVDVSSLPDLEVLILSRNEITSLDVSHNPKLKNLGVSMLEKDGLTGKLTELDLSNNPALTYIDIDGNKLSSLDLSNNKELTTIDVDNNELQALDVSMLPKLEYLYAESNALRKIDVTKNPALIRLYVSGNAGITSMDMSNNPNLKELGVQQTTLFFLDVKNNPNLEILHVGNNPLLGFEIPDGGGSLPILYYNFLRAITVKATPEGTFDLGQLVPELDSSRISDLKGADRIEGTTLYGLKDGVDVTYYYRIGTMADGRKPNMLARIHIVQDPLPVGEAELNVHVLNSTATPEMLKQMNPILIAADGTQYQPNEIANGFRARFQDIPEGDYTVKFTYPSGYRFKAGTNAWRKTMCRKNRSANYGLLTRSRAGYWEIPNSVQACLSTERMKLNVYQKKKNGGRLYRCVQIRQRPGMGIVWDRIYIIDRDPQRTNRQQALYQFEFGTAKRDRLRVERTI